MIKPHVVGFHELRRDLIITCKVDERYLYYYLIEKL